MDINYELYKVFYYVAKSLSFSDAATELFISQSAVSQSVKTLEKRLGQTLFTRSTKKVALTKEGEMLFKHIEPAINLIVKGESQLMSSREKGEEQLRIAASDTICRYFLVPYFSKFHQKFPNVHIKVINQTSLGCAELLEQNKADLIVANSPNPALNNSMEIEEIRTFKDVFIADKTAYPFENKVFTLRELSKMPILMLDKHSTTSVFLHEQFIKQSIDLAPSVELSSNDLLVDLASIGLGIAFVPDFCFEKSGRENLYVLKTKEKIPARKLVAAYDENIPLSETAEFFLNLLMEKDNE
ncbi:MAG: LysR family transcriptional regulator [Lachnospiraceae bacterium]|nr:LysR family transcriptional regulator [Lachnospiraceae bacterium]